MGHPGVSISALQSRVCFSFAVAKVETILKLPKYSIEKNEASLAVFIDCMLLLSDNQMITLVVFFTSCSRFFYYFASVVIDIGLFL